MTLHFCRIWTLIERERMFALENVYFTDCILRNMYEYRFIAHWDFDEVPILRYFRHVSELLQYISTTLVIYSKFLVEEFF